MLAFGFGSPADWIIILVIALIVFGPKKLPEVGKQLGQAMREFRKITDEFTGMSHSVRDEVESVYKPILTMPAPAQTTSSATVERSIAHGPYDQEPADLMAPVVPAVSKPEPGKADGDSADAKGK